MTLLDYWARGTLRFDVVSLVFSATLGPCELEETSLFHIPPLFSVNR